MPVATVTTSKKKPKKLTPKVTPEQHVEAVKSFMHTCMRVRYNKAGLPKSKQASDEAREAVAKEAGDADEDSFSVSKRLFKSRGDDAHPLIEEVNAWARKVDKWRNVYTFSMAADDTIDSDSLKKARGERLVRAEDVETFEKGLSEMEVEGLTLSKKLFDQYEQVMALEKARLKKEFKPSDYPDRDNIWRVVERDGKKEEYGILRIGRRQYSEVTASVRLPKVVLQRMTTQAAELMNQSVEVAVADIVTVISETFLTLSKQLGDRVRVRPPHNHPLRLKVGTQAEVLSVRESVDGHDKPVKYVTLKWAGEGRAKFQDEFGPYDDAGYAALRPEPMEETKRLTTSVIERLGEQLDVFNNLKLKLGVYGEHLDEALDAIRELYHRATRHTEKKTGAMIENIKASSYFRETLREELDNAVENLSSIATEAKTVRRKLHSGIAAQVQAALKAAKK